MSATKILWGQILTVFLIVLATTWTATQWTAWRLGFQAQLGTPWFELAGWPVYYPPSFFLWWYFYDAYAPSVFMEGGLVAASGGFIAIAVAIGMSVWRARENKEVETFGSLPFAVLLIAPMALLSAIAGVWFTGGDNNIFTQIGFVVLVGLAAKNAILIVEFARAKEDEGVDPLAAVLEAARLRLRPILMTSLAFIAGVIPLVIATGAGAEMRHAMGIAVFAGMLGVTLFGLLLTPIFYVVVRRLAIRRSASPQQATEVHT